MQAVVQSAKRRAAQLMMMLCAALACLAVVAGCTPGTSTSNSQTSATANTSTSKETKVVELQIMADGVFAQALAEVEQLYMQTHEDVDVITYDPAKALAELEEAGALDEESQASADVTSSAASADDAAEGEDASAEDADASASAASPSAAADQRAPRDNGREQSVDSAVKDAIAAEMARTDIVFAMSKAAMDALEQRGEIDPASRFDLMSNRLVVVTAASNKQLTVCTLTDIASGEHTVAVGAPDLPCGESARQALPPIRQTATAAAAADVVVEFASEKELFEAVQSGACEVGLVYESDVYRFGSCKVVGTVDASAYQAVDYPVAVLNASEDAEAANSFLAWCATNADARAVFRKWGFSL